MPVVIKENFEEVLPALAQGRNRVAVYERYNTGVFPRVGRLSKSGKNWIILTPVSLCTVKVSNIVKIITKDEIKLTNNKPVTKKKRKVEEIPQCKKKATCRKKVKQSVMQFRKKR
jgi:hypothetical protein